MTARTRPTARQRRLERWLNMIDLMIVDLDREFRDAAGPVVRSAAITRAELVRLLDEEKGQQP